MKLSKLMKVCFLVVFLFIASSNITFAETAIIVSPTESENVVGTFNADIDWASNGASGTCAYVYNNWTPTIFSGEGWNEVDCELGGEDIPAPDTDGENTLRVAAWLGAGFTSNATSDYVSFTYAQNGTLTNVSFESSNFAAGATTTLTFYYTNETEIVGESDLVFLAEFPDDEVDFSNCSAGVTVTIDGNPATINNSFCGFSSGRMYIVVTETIPPGSDVVVSIPDVINPAIAGTYPIDNFGTADVFENFIDINETTLEYVVTGAPFSGEGDGTEEAPYIITSCEQFIEMNNNLSAHYVMTTDLDCTANGNDIMIGTDEAPFTGNFDGDEYEIIINIDEDEDRIGLFRETLDAEVMNVEVAGSVIGGTNYTGGLIGYAFDTMVRNVSVTADVSGQFYDIGGLAGHFEGGEISDSNATGQISQIVDESNISNTGGLVGHLEDNAIIVDSYATGEVEGYSYVGGLVGNVEDASVIDSYATGHVYGQEYLGGLVGYYEGTSEDKIFHSYATGLVEGVNDLGGLIGYATDGVISQSYSTGNVIGTEGDNVGGFIGTANNDLIIRDSYARGNATIVAGEGSVGGFIGEINDVNIFNSYSTGDVTSDGNLKKAGFTGSAASSGSIYNSFWDTDTSGMSDGCWNSEDCGVVGKTTAQMKMVSTFFDAGWDLDDIWEILPEENDGYPYLFMTGDDVEYDIENNSPVNGPVETILDENLFVGGGEAQGWNDDDEVWEYELPFRFYFYGKYYEMVYVSSNGFVSFEEENDYSFDIDDGIGVPLITAMAKDMRTDINEGDDIYITEEDDRVIFRWQATDYDNEDSISNFEIILNKDHSFQINYGDQNEPLDYEPPVGVHDGDESYVASEYNGRINFDNLNTSAWEWDKIKDDDKSKSKKGTSAKRKVKNLIDIGKPDEALAFKQRFPGAFDGSVNTIPQISSSQPIVDNSGIKNVIIDLEFGMNGADVKILQLFLIGQGTGPAAIALQNNSATEYFGPLTQNALVEWQLAHGISPALGYFGPITRAKIAELLQ